MQIIILFIYNNDVCLISKGAKGVKMLRPYKTTHSIFTYVRHVTVTFTKKFKMVATSDKIDTSGSGFDGGPHRKYPPISTSLLEVATQLPVSERVLRFEGLGGLFFPFLGTLLCGFLISV